MLELVQARLKAIVVTDVEVRLTESERAAAEVENARDGNLKWNPAATARPNR